MNSTSLPVRGKYHVVSNYLDDEFALYHNAYQCGVNIEVPAYTDALAIHAGVVLYTGKPSEYLGRCVVVKSVDAHGYPTLIRYFHLDTIKVNEGDRLKAGDAVGTFGKGLDNSNIKYLRVDLCKSLEDTLAWPLTSDEDGYITALFNFHDPKEYLKELGLVL